MISSADALAALCQHLGVHTAYTDGLGRSVVVDPDTLVRICRARGASLESPEDAEGALRALRAAEARRVLPPVVVAWEGEMVPVHPGGDGPDGAEPAERGRATLRLEDGDTVPVVVSEDGALGTAEPLPWGYHTLALETAEGTARCTVLSAPRRAWAPEEPSRGWGVATHLAALRTARSRCVADLRDFEALCHWMASYGADLVTALPLLPTFNTGEPEPSPYAPVSRLFWSELLVDLDGMHRPVGRPERLDVGRADAEVREGLEDAADPGRQAVDAELRRYADFRGAQARLGRNWRDWPEAARRGTLRVDHVDEDEARFHRVAQTRARAQLTRMTGRLEAVGIRLGLDLPVGAHPDGYDTWSRQGLFASEASVGAPPDPGFPSGQDWGFPPVDPDASRAEGHAYFAASVRHHARVAGVLRVDHVMALSRLYWIPRGLPLDRGTYVSYPMEELLAVLTLESHRGECEIVGENLGTVPEEIRRALPRHGLQGMYLTLYEAAAGEIRAPDAAGVAMLGTHDTPTFTGWVDGVDIDERIRTGLLDADDEPAERAARKAAVETLAGHLGVHPRDRAAFLHATLQWLGRSDAPRVIPWIEDLWMERDGVNLPGTRSSDRANWQRPLCRLLEELLGDKRVMARVEALDAARREGRTNGQPPRGDDVPDPADVPDPTPALAEEERG